MGKRKNWFMKSVVCSNSLLKSAKYYSLDA